jgi:hypothetical protein
MKLSYEGASESKEKWWARTDNGDYEATADNPLDAVFKLAVILEQNSF